MSTISYADLPGAGPQSASSLAPTPARIAHVTESVVSAYLREISPERPRPGASAQPAPAALAQPRGRTAGHAGRRRLRVPSTPSPRCQQVQRAFAEA